MTPIYHITHFSNLQTILKAEGLWCDSKRREQGFPIVGIAHQHIKERRERKRVPLTAGGTLADYVPFYFAPRSPMLFAIYKKKVEAYQGGQAEILHLVSSVEKASRVGPWCFTDGHADLEITQFSDDLGQMDDLVNAEIMQSRYWNDTPGQPDRKRRRQAEFLVQGCFPWKLIDEIGVLDATIAAEVGKAIKNEAHKPRIAVRRDWYY
jgi:hypothetical protein